MGLRSWLRERMRGGSSDRSQPATPDEATTGNQPGADSATPSSPWAPLPAYLPVNPQEHRAACVIASAIAAGDRPTSELRIRSVNIANPEYHRVAVIATALAAGALPESAFTVKAIYKHKEEENSHAA